VLHLLRYWYVVDALRIRGRRPTEVQKRS
jgi:hypothetical protein